MAARRETAGGVSERFALINETVLYTVLKAISGGLGASIISLFWRPKALAKMSLWFAGVLTGGVGAAMAIFLTGFIAQLAGLDVDDHEHIMAIGLIIGMMSLSVANWLANFQKRRESSDIAEIAVELRKGQRDDD